MKVIFTVTNDLSYDQRMQRICHSLVSHGYEVMLVGRTLPYSIPLEIKRFEQKRLPCFFKKGFAFYAEYNLRLFCYLLFKKGCDVICSIDLDTLPAGFLASVIRRKKRVFDAHEYFTEVPEVVHRPFVKFFWEAVAVTILPFYRNAYTVSPSLADIFEKKYGLKFAVIRNMATGPDNISKINPNKSNPVKTILYQGALNEGRGLEAAITAMLTLENVQLLIAGEGDLSIQLRSLCAELNVEDKVIFLGFVTSQNLKNLTADAWVGINLLENKGLSYYYSLANKFFDYIQAGVPVITMNFPEYRALNREHEVAVLLSELTPATVENAIRRLISDEELYRKLSGNCMIARKLWNWENEEKELLRFWSAVNEA